MFKIENVTEQPLVLDRSPASVLHLLPRSAAVISKDELQAPQIQNLLAAGALRAQPLKARRARKKEAEKPAKRREN
jgi:hypothetical protein